MNTTPNSPRSDDENLDLLEQRLAQLQPALPDPTFISRIRQTTRSRQGHVIRWALAASIVIVGSVSIASWWSRPTIRVQPVQPIVTANASLKPPAVLSARRDILLDEPIWTPRPSTGRNITLYTAASREVVD